MPSPSHLPWFGKPYNICSVAQIMKLPILWLSPFSSCLLHLRLKCILHHTSTGCTYKVIIRLQDEGPVTKGTNTFQDNNKMDLTRKVNKSMRWKCGWDSAGSEPSSSRKATGRPAVIQRCWMGGWNEGRWDEVGGKRGTRFRDRRLEQEKRNT